jgi:hypothetical protein
MGDGTIDAFEAAVPRNSSSHHIYKWYQEKKL